MLPREVTIIPQYLLFHQIGWLDTYWPLIVPQWLAGSSFGVFLMRQFLLTIPRDFDDAARVDGANSFQIFWNVLLPLSKPALASLAIFAFIGNWNMLWEPLIFLSSTEKFTLSIGLTWFQKMSRRLVVTSAPLVVPQMAIRPPRHTSRTLAFTLDHASIHLQHIIGHFRLLVTASEKPDDNTKISAAVLAILKTPVEQRTREQRESLSAFYRAIAPQLARTREELAGMKTSGAPGA